ncbi:MAG TPA: hypothetical protein PLV64_23215 [Anaerolineales bacterium]|jgi:hypothetical protein|nr:hypothetical protein [Anaerolineales bacterium]
MIRSAPTIDFHGALQVRSLEVGSLLLNDQSVPAVRFTLKQNQTYPLLASGQEAGQIFAYCAAALEHGIEEIHSRITSVLVTDTQGGPHVVVSEVTWFTSNRLREQAASRILRILEGGSGDFPYQPDPFARIRAS